MSISPQKALVLIVLVIFSTFCSSPNQDLVISKDVQHMIELDSMSLDSIIEMYPERTPLWEYAISEDSIGIENVKNAVEAILSQGKIPVFYYGADWCSPCVKIKKIVLIKPEIKEALSEFGFIYVDVSGKVKAYKIALELSDKHEVHTIPCFVRSDRELNKLRRLVTTNWSINKELNLTDFSDYLKEDEGRRKKRWVSMTGPIDSITPYKRKKDN